MSDSEFKYTTRFDFPIKTVYASEHGQYISEASLKELKTLASDHATIKSNYDLLYNVFNAAVVNRVNKNDDAIDSETAVAIYKHFIHKPCNLEHKRDLVVGHIINAGFSEYKTNIEYDEAKALETTHPYYISLSAVVYKLVDSEFCDMLIEASDETSASYNQISTSWELGFNSYYIALGSRDLEQATLVKDPTEIEVYSKYLRVYGGAGKLDDGTPVYRVISGNVLPLGIGYTTTPAAEVVGVLVTDSVSIKLVKEDENNSNTSDPIVEDIVEEVVAIQQISENQDENKNISSQTNCDTVKTNSIMKINKLEDITDDLLKEVSAANFKAFLSDYIDDISTKHAERADKAELEAQKKAQEAAAKEQETEEVKQTLADLNNQLEELKSKLAEEQQARAGEKAQADFNSRMAAIEGEYNLSDKDRAIVRKNILNKDDESYAEWLEDWKVVAETKHKSYKPVAADTSVASVNTVEDVLDTATASDASISNVITDKASIKAKWAENFKVEDIVVIK